MARTSYRLKFLAGLDGAHKAAAEHKELPHVKDQLASTFLQLPIPNQILSEGRDRNFTELGPDVDLALESFFSLTTTVPCELANRQGRQNQERAQDNCRMSAERVMLVPYKDRVMSQGGNYFKYDEVSHEEYSQQTAKHATTKKLDNEFFKPGSHPPILPLKAAATTSQKADFYTTSPFNSAEVYAHVNYWRHCVRNPTAWEKGESLWLAQLLFCGQLVTCKATKVSSLVVNSITNLAALSLKLTPKKMQSVDVLTLSSAFAQSCAYSWLFVLDLTEYTSRRYKVAGHSWRLFHHRTLTPAAAAKVKVPTLGEFKGGPFIVPYGPELTLFQASAYNCFKPMGIVTLKLLGGRVGVEIKPTDDLFDVIEILLLKAHPKMLEDERALIHDKRAYTSEDKVVEQLFTAQR